MRHSFHFKYGDEWSYNMGVKQVKLESGLFDDQVVSNKTILEEKIEGREKPYHFGVDREPISFTLNILFEDNLDNRKMGDILRWLDSDYYKPMWFKNDPEKMYYAMSMGDARIIHNGIRDGYLTLEFRTNHPTALSPAIHSNTYRIRSTTTIEFENDGDFDCKPIVHIRKVGNGTVTIRNMSNDTGEFKFTGLRDEELVSVDCETKEIESSEDLFRYDNFSKNYLVLRRGFNRIRVTGNCDLVFETEFKIY